MTLVFSMLHFRWSMLHSSWHLMLLISWPHISIVNFDQLVFFASFLWSPGLADGGNAQLISSKRTEKSSLINPPWVTIRRQGSSNFASWTMLSCETNDCELYKIMAADSISRWLLPLENCAPFLGRCLWFHHLQGHSQAIWYFPSWPLPPTQRGVCSQMRQSFSP